MQNDKQNNQVRSAIEELDQLPDGFNFNSRHTWAKIEEKLPGKQQRTTAWYYAAAAIVLLAGISSFFYFKTSPGNNNASTGFAVTVNPVFSTSPKENKNSTPRHVSVSAARSPIKANITKNKTAVSSPVLKEEENTDPKETLVTSAAETLPATVAVTEPITSKEEKKKPVVSAAKKPVAKRYRVIHINELDAMPVAPASGNLTKSEFRKMMNQQIEEKELSQPTENNTRSLFFFKTRPSNTSTNTIVENN